jgi:thiol:disulfide interchange protein
VISIVFPILLIVQSLLPEPSRWIAALHPVNAFILLGMACWLSWILWRGADVTAEESPAAQAV